MAFNSQAGSSSQAFETPPFAQYGSSPRAQHNAPQFDVLEWYPHFQNCLRFFLDHAQHESVVQALAAFLNIQLPFQKQPNPVISSNASSPRSAGQDAPHLRQQNALHHQQTQAVSLLPYIRRLVVTGHDTPGILHGFFGDDWLAGIGQLHEVERRNYMFAAKSTNWLSVKQAYDMGPDETVPFLSPLKDAGEKEIQQAESTWSEWLAMQDWMLGPRSPEMRNSPRIKREARD
ncbi:uncharacterized protein RSE6_10516 [Rhynchosporium secalis]|uniref:Ilp is an apoptosis inhibitor n=1 Tax=Rhynchosporium secalis TaxID=38038 RepID=A0A1E1MKN1_RHYSE|nr:uncharacterized protein RSE6_10516 [Rhynchosporium secalis]